MAKKTPKARAGHGGGDGKLGKAVARARAEVEKRQRQLERATDALAALEARRTATTDDGAGPGKATEPAAKAKGAETMPTPKESAKPAPKAAPSHTTSPAGAVASTERPKSRKTGGGTT